jgi:hypothetical protein
MQQQNVFGAAHFHRKCDHLVDQDGENDDGPVQNVFGAAHFHHKIGQLADHDGEHDDDCSPRQRRK